MSWFNFEWTAEDRQLLRIWRDNRGKFVSLIDESRSDPNADEIPYPFLPIIIGGEKDSIIDIYSKVRNKKTRIVLTVNQRKQIFDLKGRYCDVCANKRSLEIHHIDNDPSNNRLDNLQVVCHECHTTIIGHVQKSK